jgi:two-component system response regulator YesN
VYRVLIVEDEEPVLESYEFMLRGADGFALAGKARTGFEALRLIGELEPDLVFMDINIPGKDGLSVIEEVYRRFPAIVFILSTAYERFDLAQRAIPLGVFAYLVKPVSKKTFYSALENAKAQLDSRLVPGPAGTSLSPGGGPGARGKPSRFPLAGAFLRNAREPSPESAEWETIKDRFNLPSGRGIICFLEFQEDAERWTGALAEKVLLKYFCLFETLGNRGCLFLSGDIRREEFEKHLKSACKDLPDDIQPVSGVGCFASREEIAGAFTRAREELDKALDRSAILYRERLRLAQLRRKLGIAEADETRRLFRAFWEEVFLHYDFVVAKAKMVPVFMFLQDDVFGFYGGSGAPPPGEHAPAFSPVEEIMALKDGAAWENWAVLAFEEIMEQARVRRSMGLPLPLRKALEYIREHYTLALTLVQAAEAAGVSPSYLSRLFSEHLKTNFIDYLTDLRIEKAEKLLKESPMSVKEIAFTLGFQDPAYFSKLFKKVKGMLPTAVKNNQ